MNCIINCIIFWMMLFVLSGCDWQTLKVIDPVQGKSANRLACPWCFPLMIIPWCKSGQRSHCLFLNPLCTLCLCPLTVKYTSCHLLKSPSSSLPSFLTSSFPSHCSHCCGSCSTLGKWEHLDLDLPSLWGQQWCGMTWETLKRGDSTPPWPLGRLFSVKCIKMCGITLTGGT